MSLHCSTSLYSTVEDRILNSFFQYLVLSLQPTFKQITSENMSLHNTYHLMRCLLMTSNLETNINKFSWRSRIDYTLLSGVAKSHLIILILFDLSAPYDMMCQCICLEIRFSQNIIPICPLLVSFTAVFSICPWIPGFNMVYPSLRCDLRVFIQFYDFQYYMLMIHKFPTSLFPVL